MIRIFVAMLAGFLIALGFFWPVYEASLEVILGKNSFYVAVSSIGLAVILAGLLTILLCWTNRSISVLALLPIVASLVLVRLIYFGLIQFSGDGFTDEFFIHLEWESVVVAWQEYGRLMRRALILLVLMMGLIVLLVRGVQGLSLRAGAILVLSGFVVMVPARNGSPEFELFNAWRGWVNPPRIEVDRAELQRWQNSGLVETRLPRVRELEVRSPETPKNLILLYLESIGVALTEHPEWPELMPNLRALIERHGLVAAIHTSSYITIEGITNTQCGTLFSFNHSSHSLAGGDGLAEQMPCLGNVLEAAGYHQVYMGGATLGFAGKGAFLAAHGYDELHGIEEWRSMGLDKRPGTWGLSDADLFEQSIKRMLELEESEQPEQPWNMTLLTIGTHLPGYRYAECEPYREDVDAFIDALHCTDQLLADWLERLETEGLLGNSVVVITADHHVFPNPDMERLFGDAIMDRRLPLVVIGNDILQVGNSTGAGYDLAPTILDLLDIEHNARFALGRSLLRENPDRNYFVKRYADMHDNERIANAPSGCAEQAGQNGGAPVLPLNPCEKRTLFSVLDAVAQAYTEDTSRLRCELDPALSIEVPSPGEPLVFTVNRTDQSNRFTLRSRPVNPVDPGVFVAVFDAGGNLLGRRAVPANRSTEVAEIEELSKFEGARFAVVVWRPPEDDLPSGEVPLVGVVAPGMPAAWLVDLRMKQIVRQEIAQAPGSVLEFGLSAQECQRLLGEQHAKVTVTNG